MASSPPRSGSSVSTWDFQEHISAIDDVICTENGEVCVPLIAAKVPDSILSLMHLTDIFVIPVGVPLGLTAEVFNEKVDKAAHLG